jgi:hypothetical protein
MASGHVNRANRPNTWLHRPSPRREVFPCQPGAGPHMAQGQERIKLSNDAVGTLRCADVSYLSLLAQPVFARTYMKCATRKVILVSTPNRWPGRFCYTFP